MDNKDEFWLQENYITNVDEIIELAEKEKDKFSNRGKDSANELVSLDYGPSKLRSLWMHNMSEELKAAILKTLPSDEQEVPPNDILINRYDVGSYLVRHRDVGNKCWKFHLVFLRADKPHFKVYNDKYPEGLFIDEKPGSLFHFPINLEHEVTTIEEGEKPKYSLILVWSL